jgi:2-phosphosulfolactate phosphatase
VESKRAQTSTQMLARWEVSNLSGAVIVVDVLRAFTTAAYAFAAGAREIQLVDTVEEARAAKTANPLLLLVGEDHGRKPEGFDFSNSPVHIATADLEGRTLVQRTSAGTRGVVAARSATRLWCASLVCASATAREVRSSSLAGPTYVITGRSPDAPDTAGFDDLFTAELIERARLGVDLHVAATVELVLDSAEAQGLQKLEFEDSHPEDVAYSTRVDFFDFAMEVQRINGKLLLRRSV